ncbi:Smr/MutS family protein [Novacetimonas pomaceti]|uniref:DNA mismatch repair protein n=1 Tax=Novacetimonas pomaceti TaxID=2021998 RepID=A0ABX5P536_9PROT|nr:Smr/MutS family protein [Novacetimonas pomaceti]PYD48895.1 DNA mismatch repair protein [Novacetimonas pomaceti]
MRRRRTLNQDEQALWAAFTQDISPLRHARAARPATPRAAPAEKPAQAAGPPASSVSMDDIRRLAAPGLHHHAPSHGRMEHDRGSAIEIGVRRPGLDDTSWRGLVSGRLRPQRRLDLHGQIAQTAFHRLHAFLLQARVDNVRCVEIITGLGSGANGGILRRELPLWLGRADMRRFILAVVHPHAANQGAVRVLLRRQSRR